MTPKRKTLHNETWSWNLDQVADGLLLTVVCGSVGLYERTVVLEPSEAIAWQQHGPAGLEPLVEAIRSDSTGERFAHRYHPGINAEDQDL